MVTLKREAKTESERYGGFATGMSSEMSNYDRFMSSREVDTVDQAEDFEARYYDDSQQYKDYLWQELSRTAPRRMLSPEEVKSGVRPEDVQQEQTEYVSRYSQSAQYAPSAQSVSRDERKAQGLTLKAKLVMVAYVAVVVFMLTLIAVNAGTLATLKSEISALEAGSNAGVSSEILGGSTGGTVIEDSLAFGTGTEGSLQGAVYAGDYTMMSVGTPVVYEASSSWFDGICDWLGSVVGG